MSQLGLRDRAVVAVQRALVLRLLALPPRVQLRLAGGTPRVVDGNTLDPQAQLLIALGERLDPLRPCDVPIEEARRTLERSGHVVAGPLRPMARVYDTTTDAAHRQVPVRVYVPRGLSPDAGEPRAKDAPALLFFHGGGFALGSVDSHDPLCRELADDAKRLVVSVDYARSPEHKFPAAIDDGIAAFEWLHARARDLGVNAARIAVAGDSAGGNLSAVVTNALRRAGGPMPEAQVLIYPATDMTRSMRSHALFREGFFLDERTIAWFTEHYLRSRDDERNPLASPLFEPELRGLPRSMVITAGFDPLRDEGDAYAAKLAAAGVPTEHVRELGMFHGYMSTTGGVTAAQRTRDAIVRFLMG
jgi:acetyl esterase